jgi:hypothetical protein
MADLKYLGVVSGLTRGALGLGDHQLGNGVAIRVDADGTILLYAASFNPVVILEGELQRNEAGGLGAKWRSLGSLPCTWSKPWGVFYDALDPAIYLTCHSDCDGDAPIAATLSRGRFDADGMLYSDGQWAFADRSDKMTDGGVTSLPDGRLAVGFGGYRSVVATGPASMGAALAAFDRPTAPGPIPCTSLLAYPYASAAVPRMTRPPNYINDVGAENNYPTPAPGDPLGVTTWGDWSQQSGTWIETATLSGLLMIWQRATGRIWYTNTVNAEGWQYDLVVYDGSLLNGDHAPNAYQPAIDEPFTPPIPLPVNGQHADTPAHVITGVSFDPRSRILVVGVQGYFGTDAATQATGYLLFEVLDGPELRTWRVTRATVEQQTIDATDAETACDAAEASPDAWAIASASSSAEPIP